MIDHLATAARVQAVAVRVYDAAADARVVERLVARIASSALANTPAELEDAEEVAGVGYSTAAVVAVEHGEVLLACLGQLGSCSLEAYAYKQSHWRLAALG